MDICTHERRPGTTVCLHCRHAARLAARTQRKRLIIRSTAIAAAVIAVSAGGVLGATALRGRGEAPAQSNARAKGVATVARATPTSAAVEQAGTVATAQAPIAPDSAATGTSVQAPLAPVIPAGTTVIADGVRAERVDSAVTLSFDAPLTRTRMPEKFERFLRTTLEQVYGSEVDSVLAKVPPGTLVANQGTLLYDLPTRGIHIPVQDRWQLAIYPETRPGQDGPLVIRYRVAVVSGMND